MGQTCRGICEFEKSHPDPRKLKYESGHKWCSLCASYFYTEKNICKCCKTKLRSKARGKGVANFHT